MELTRRVEKEWDEAYRINSPKLIRGSSVCGFEFVRVLAKNGNGQGWSQMDIPYSSVNVTYRNNASPELTIHKQLVTGRETEAHTTKDYWKEEIVKADFVVPFGYEVIRRIWSA